MNIDWNFKNTITLKQKFIIIAIVAFLIALIGLAYGWVTNPKLGQSQAISLTSASISFNYRGTSPTILANLAPGETVEKTFEIINNGVEAVSYNLLWENIINTFEPTTDIIYSVSEKTLGELVSPRVAPVKDVGVYYNLVLAPGEIHYLSLTITFILDEERDQSANIGNYFSGDMTVVQGVRDMNNYIAIYYNDEVTNEIPLEDVIYNERRSWCTDGTTVSYNTTTNEFEYANLTNSTTCQVYFETYKEFDYVTPSGAEQTWTIPSSGTYKLETWGAEGGGNQTYTTGGYGGYSVGEVYIDKTLTPTLHINVGGMGNSFMGWLIAQNIDGGYNGGGGGYYSRSSGTYNSVYTICSGGGATHISSQSGLLSTLENYRSSLLIVSGGGGGGYRYVHDGGAYIVVSNGGHGGGYLGGRSGTMENPGYAFGQGGLDPSGTTQAGSFGGGGYLGGIGGNYNIGGAGGSGYIGNLINKTRSMYMYCTGTTCATYNYESNEDETKTVIGTCVNSDPISNCSKTGNGYARITYAGEVETHLLEVDLTGGTQTKDYNGEYYEGNIYQIEEPTRDGYTFTGWTIEGIGSTIDNGGLLKVGVSNIKLTANWGTSATFDYVEPSGREQTWTVPATGTYKLEVWGASGGNATYQGGYGGYSVGNISLTQGQTLYVNVGGSTTTKAGGYNGGGIGGTSSGKGGGGATHIATTNGLLSALSNNISSILIVSGGGSGADGYSSGAKGAHGGGYKGMSGNITGQNTNLYAGGGTQILGGAKYDTSSYVAYSGSFGLGGNGHSSYGSGGGSGFYGGGGGGAGGTWCATGGGGSGYIGNLNIGTRSMYTYCESNCTTYESITDEIKTTIGTCVSETATSNCAKTGNGYARISYIEN